MILLNDNKSLSLKVLRVILKIIIFLILHVSLLVFGPFIIITGLLLKVFSTKLSIVFLSYFAFFFWSLYNLLFILTVKVENLKKKKIENIKNSLVISNHLSSGDFCILNFIFKENLQNCKYVFKDSLRYIPIFYQGCLLLHMLVLKRNYEKDKITIKNYIENIKKYKIDATIFFFPEGTRFNEYNSQKSIKFCKERNLSPFYNLLYPRFKGFNLFIENIRNSYIKNLIDVTIYFENRRVPSLLDYVFNGNFFYLKYSFDTFSINEIKDSKDFLTERFQIKEKNLENLKNKK